MRLLDLGPALAACGLVLSIVPGASAQSVPIYNWQVEVHVGGAAGTSPRGGTGSLPGPGQPFATLLGLPESRAVPSWAFGDGTTLFNDVAARTLNGARITPLDPWLVASLSRQRAGANFGFRLTRVITSRLSVEGSAEFNWRRGELDAAVPAAVEATRASYEAAFTGLFAQAPQIFTSPALDVTAEIAARGGYEVMGSGVLRVNLGTASLQPYVVMGAGVVGGMGEFPSFTLRGDYQWVPPNQVGRIHQTDTVIVRQHVGIGGLAIVGAGVSRDLSARVGLRADARLYVGGNTLTTRLETSASSISNGQVALVFPANSSPALSFSSVGQMRSSLSGSTSMTSFKGSGARTLGVFCVGFFVKL